MSNVAFSVTARQSKQVSSYAGSRPDVLAHVRAPTTVLDVGCNEGALARDIRSRFPGARVWGMDINPDAIAKARDVLESGYCLNLDSEGELEQCLGEQTFDTIIAADVLEHTVNPWAVLKQLVRRLNDGGEVLVSLPNFGHWETIFHLLRQRFPRRSRGLYDDTHLRFFMLRNLPELAIDSCRIEIVQRNYRIWERCGTFVDRRLFGPVIDWIPWVREYFVFQYIIRVEKPSP